MALSDADVQKQIDHMIAFIEQEAKEKVEEIEAKAEEEFNIEKGRLVQDQRLKIMEFYDKKEKQVELQKKILNSGMLNNARLKVLKAREDHIRTVLDETRKELNSHTRDPRQYQEVLKNLLLQSVYQLLEREVLVKCRKQDVTFITACLGSVAKEYHDKTGQTCKVTIDEENYLSSEISGGVECSSQKGKIKVNNTLESRLDMISQQLLPEIRDALFGSNPNRRFRD